MPRFVTCVALVCAFVATEQLYGTDPLHNEGIRNYLPKACRILDTRAIGTGDKLPQNTQLDFSLKGSGSVAQGGQAGCSIPDVAVGAIINLTAFTPSSGGNVALWPHAMPMPELARVLNVYSGVINENNGLDVPLGFGTSDLSLIATFESHFIVDIVGWTQPGNTAVIWGTVQDIQVALPGPPADPVYDYTLDNGVHITCTSPWANVLDCAAVTIGDTIVGSGHVNNFFGTVYVTVHDEMTVN